MNRALRTIIAVIATPFIPWAVYWVAFAGFNAANIIAGKEVVHFANANQIWVATGLAMLFALAIVLYELAFKPKAN